MQYIDDQAAGLSIDFIAGFTIFLIAFIVAITMVSGLLVGLQSKTIDYDAVAYRTGVILAEDPGWTVGNNISWEYYPDSEATRFGLAVSRDYPNILSSRKVSNFFIKDGSTIQDKTMMFREGTTITDYYPYNFNIALKDDNGNSWSAGDSIFPDKFGYSRRIVKIMQDQRLLLPAPTDSTKSIKVVTYKNPSLPGAKSLYGVDPYYNGVIINITGIAATQLVGDPLTLTSITVERVVDESIITTIYPGTADDQYKVTTKLNGAGILDEVDLLIYPLFPAFGLENQNPSGIQLHYTFEGATNIGGTASYDNTIPQPTLTDAVMEVRIW